MKQPLASHNITKEVYTNEEIIKEISAELSNHYKRAGSILSTEKKSKTQSFKKRTNTPIKVLSLTPIKSERRPQRAIRIRLNRKKSTLSPDKQTRYITPIKAIPQKQKTKRGLKDRGTEQDNIK